MDVKEKAGSPAADPAVGQTNRRAHRRFPVDEDSVVIMVGRSLPMHCRILDLSIEGCRVRVRDRFVPAPRSRVEIAFKINGIAFRFSGLARWTDGRHQAGIRFVDVPARRKDDLAEVLAEVEAAEAAKAAKEAEKKLEAGRAAEQAAPQDAVAHALQGPSAQQISSPARTEAAPKPPAPPKPSGSERRTHARFAVDTSAAIILVKIGSRIEGRILDLSLAGCRILSNERFPVGIYTRVETEFHLEGLPFRLGGVVQALHNRNQVGIRFLDMSERKRREVSQLIEEIREMRENADSPGEA
jgi:PilZ domain